MQVAAYVDAAGELAGFNPEGTIRLYERTPRGWALKTQFCFGVTSDMNLAEIKSALRKVAVLLGSCRTLVFGETRGLLYAILADELGFRVWKSEGPADARLDAVAAREREAEEAARTAPPPSPFHGGGCGCGGGRKTGGEATLPPAAQRTASGGWQVDLGAALAADPNRNSYDTLMPLLRDGDRLPLDIACNHLPRWFEGAMAQLGLAADIRNLSDGSLRVVVRRCGGASGVPGSRCGAACGGDRGCA